MKLIFTPSHNSNVDPDAPLEQVRRVTSKVEDLIDNNTRGLRPYLPGLGRFLIVVTFLEDALRCALGKLHEQ